MGIAGGLPWGVLGFSERGGGAKKKIIALGALLSSPTLDVRLPTALQVLQVLQALHLRHNVCFVSFFLSSPYILRRHKLRGLVT